MKVLLIPDKFKGSLTASEVIESITKGIKKAYPEASIHPVMASDGGEGFLDAILENVNCEIIKCNTVDPLGRAIEAKYLYNPLDSTAYIELANASGLSLLKASERDVMQTSTLGTGLQIMDAIQKGAKSIYIGLGGSATNDAGLGIAEALGHYFLDDKGNQLPPVGSNLAKIKSIHKRRNATSIKGVSFFAVNDVDNPLFGPEGAAYTYARQKGATNEEIKELDCGIQDFSNLVQLQTKKDVAALSGAGAAGGTAYGLKVFCDAKYVSGIGFLSKTAKVEESLAQNDFDYIITGEGKFDSQTLRGKLIHGVLDLGERFGVPVLAVCGQLDLEKSALDKYKNLTVLEIKDGSKSLDENMKNTGALLEKSVQIFLRG